MEETRRFSGSLIKNKTPNDPVMMHLNHEKRSTDLLVCGDEISHQFSVDGNTLLISHFDWLEGVSYWFKLVSERQKLIDVVSTPHYFGFIENISVTSENTLEFGFFNSRDRWRLHFNIPGKYCTDPRGFLRRPLRFWLKKCFLEISHIKQE